MSDKNELLEQTIDDLHKKAASSAQLAKVQRKNADSQHESAHNLEKLSDAIEDDATKLQKKLDDKK